MLFNGFPNIWLSQARAKFKGRTGIRGAAFFGVTMSAIGGFYWFRTSNGDVELHRDDFRKYRISYKHQIDQNHFLMELTPLVEQKVNLWKLMGSDKLWSVEFKQPEIMVVRNYTPLPLQYNAKTGDVDRLASNDNAGGKLFFYMKQYQQGEVARWVNKKCQGDILELRGPYVEYQLPVAKASETRSQDFAMYSAGTGIVPALQLLLNASSPFIGRMQLFYSCNSIKQLGPLQKHLQSLSQESKLQLHLFESAKGTDIKKSTEQIMKLIAPPASNSKFQESIKPALALVCGPDEYIKTIAGERLDFSQGPVGGLLQKKGWTSVNVYKLS